MGLVRYVSLLAALVLAVVVSAFAASHREYGTVKDSELISTKSTF
jgi:hypothetical protein